MAIRVLHGAGCGYPHLRGRNLHCFVCECGLNLLQGRCGLYLVQVRVEKFFVQVTECWAHGHRKDFFQGWPLGDFSKIFPGGTKSGEIWFLPLKIEKTTFFVEIFKIQGGAKAPLPMPMVEPKDMNLISSKYRKTHGCTVLELFASIVLRTVGLQQLLHCDVTTYCCKTLAQTLAMWWASEHFPLLPSYLVRNNSV